MAEGVDYSWARPGGAALVAAGKSFAVRYLSPGRGKGLDAAELADLRAHGIAVATVYESTGTEAKGGFSAGVQSAKIAAGQIAALGLPAAQVVYGAVDWDARSAAELAQIDAYLDGMASVLGAARVGIYGGLAVIQHVQASGSAAWLWQTYAWSAGRVAAGIHLYQYRNGQTINGGSVDFTRSMAAEFGQNAASTAGSGSSPVTIKKRKANMLIAHIPHGAPNGVDHLFFMFAPGFDMTFTGQLAANGFAGQIGSSSAPITQSFIDKVEAENDSRFGDPKVARAIIDLSSHLDPAPAPAGAVAV